VCWISYYHGIAAFELDFLVVPVVSFCFAIISLIVHGLSLNFKIYAYREIAVKYGLRKRLIAFIDMCFFLMEWLSIIFIFPVIVLWICFGVAVETSNTLAEITFVISLALVTYTVVFTLVQNATVLSQFTRDQRYFEVKQKFKIFTFPFHILAGVTTIISFIGLLLFLWYSFSYIQHMSNVSSIIHYVANIAVGLSVSGAIAFKSSFQGFGKSSSKEVFEALAKAAGCQPVHTDTMEIDAAVAIDDPIPVALAIGDRPDRKLIRVGRGWSLECVRKRYTNLGEFTFEAATVPHDDEAHFRVVDMLRFNNLLHVKEKIVPVLQHSGNYGSININEETGVVDIEMDNSDEKTRMVSDDKKKCKCTRCCFV